MARIRMPLTNIKRKLPNIFLGSCIALVLIFCINTLQSLGRGDLDSSSESGDDKGVRKLMQFGKLGNNKHLKRFNLNEDEEEAVCKMPKLSLKTDSNKFAFFKMPPLNCTGSGLFYLDGGKLTFNESALNGQKLDRCEYSGIIWESDDYASIVHLKTVTEHPYTFTVGNDFFKIECFLKSSSGFGLGMLGRRRLLSDQDSGIQHPRHVGSVGMPDPVINVQSANTSK